MNVFFQKYFKHFKRNQVFLSYFLICAFCFSLDSTSLLLLVYTFGFDYKIAELIGLFIGNSSNYLLSTRYAFRHPKYQNKYFEYLYYLFLGFCSYPVHHLVLVST
ncbi:GtrA family protein, partial [bacterium]|nr:GtrA family protein [bacterium]